MVKTLKISEVITQLSALKEKDGDLEVFFGTLKEDFLHLDGVGMATVMLGMEGTQKEAVVGLLPSDDYLEARK